MTAAFNREALKTTLFAHRKQRKLELPPVETAPEGEPPEEEDPVATDEDTSGEDESMDDKPDPPK